MRNSGCADAARTSKVSKRKAADGKPVYTYVRKMKERSKGSICSGKNVNGNTLEMTIEQKRAAFRTLIRKVVWDGVHAHVVLFGASEERLGEDSK